MAFRSILRVARPGHGPDEPELEFVLVYIVSNGRDDLDLKLTGTDQCKVYTTSMKQSQTSKLKAKSNKSTVEEWDNLLLEILLGKVTDGAESAAQNGTEAVAHVDEVSFTITIQKRIEGITQRLGTISLAWDEDEEIDIFSWCGKAVQAKDISRQEYEKFKTTVHEKDIRIKRLEDALTELTTLKKDNETQLLEKFSLLLNEKKLKIRDQMRMLSGASLDPGRVGELEEVRVATQSRDAGPSRKGKRKAADKPEPSDDESEDSFEKMDIDQPVANGSDQDGANTSDEATATEDEDEEPLPPKYKKKPAAAAKKGSPAVKKASPATRKASPAAKKMPPPRTKTPPARAKTPSATQDEVPPKRALPFAKKPPAAPAQPQDDGSETESDDEL